MHNGDPRIIDVCKSRGHIKRIFDCGSRDALDGIFLANALQSDELHVFEPNPESAELCRKNLAVCSEFKCYMNEVAIAQSSGTVDFYTIDTKETITPHPDGNPGASSMFQANSDYPHEKYKQIKISVPSITLGDYVSKHGVPDLLWMDLQGAEKMALVGMGDMIRNVSVIHIEVGFRPMYVGQPLFWDIDELLKQKGFVLAHISAGRWPTFLLPIYRVLKSGPWVANAIYVNNQ